jgi:hypothetical protein
VINESKTKYMSINRNIKNLEQDMIMNGHVFARVQNFRHLGALIISKNLIDDEIKSRIAAGNRCFYSLRQIFWSRAMSTAIKIKIYKTIVEPIVVFGRETRAVAVTDMTRLGTWERKI